MSGVADLTDHPKNPGLMGGLTLAVFRNLGKNHYSLVHVFSLGGESRPALLKPIFSGPANLAIGEAGGCLED